MSQETRQKPKKSKTEQIELMIRLLNSGKTQAVTATAVGVNLRTIQRWLSDPTVKERLVSIRQEANAIAKTDPVVLSVVEVRQQVEEILSYRDSQRSFALQMGLVVQKATGILLDAVERLEENPEEVSARTIPQLMKAITDAAEKVSNAWVRATGLDGVLEELGSEPKVISTREETN